MHLTFEYLLLRNLNSTTTTLRNAGTCIYWDIFVKCKVNARALIYGHATPVTVNFYSFGLS